MDRDSKGKGTEETDAFGRGRKQMEGHPPQVLGGSKWKAILPKS